MISDTELTRFCSILGILIMILIVAFSYVSLTLLLRPRSRPAFLPPAFSPILSEESTSSCHIMSFTTSIVHDYVEALATSANRSQ
jgi:hypothetical protein